MGLARSFLKGKRFALKNKDSLMCCERCVFGTGGHTCPDWIAKFKAAHPTRKRKATKAV
jgi:hypothetical protein